MQDCLICNRIKDINEGKNPYFVKELKSGYVVLGDYQFYKGYTLFLSKSHVNELHELDKSIRNTFLEEMAIVAEAVFKAFQPVKLNYEMLGNGDAHLHWHIFPRHKDDPNLKASVWVIEKSVRYAESAKPSQAESDILKSQLFKYL